MEKIILVDEDGHPLTPAKPILSEARARMDRAADLYWAFQLGEEAAAKGDIDAYRSRLIAVMGTDPEADAQFKQGLQFVPHRIRFH